MIPKGLFTQIGMVIVAIAIIITYVEPEFRKISELQSSIQSYQSERAKVEEVNARLDQLVDRMDGVSTEDVRRLRTYMPDKVDEISVRRDMFLIAQAAGVLYKNSSYEDSLDNKNNKRRATVEEVEGDSIKHTFNLSVEGTYDQLKELFSLLQQNDYILEISSLNIQPLEGSFLSANIDIVTYSYGELESVIN